MRPRPDPTPVGAFERAQPTFATPRAAVERVSFTWIGHATFLIQIGGLNVLTDPIWSERASPVQFAGPRRYMPPGVSLDDLPPIDCVLQSHDHYDHLDARSVRELARRFPEAQWFVPMGLAPFVGRRGVSRVIELDWWDEVRHELVTLRCIPSQHFSGRTFHRNRALWCGWVLTVGSRSVYFVGDTGMHGGFGEIGERCGPFDAVLMPIGAYDPRWFMAPMHLDPEEAVRAFTQLVANGNGGRHATMVGMHWGTFKLSDEPMDEPPARVRRAWRQAGGVEDDLWILAHGETRWLEAVTPGD